MREDAQDYTEIDLVELAKALLSNWLLILLAMILLGGSMGAYNRFLVKPTYTAEAQIYISNSDSIVNLQDVQLSAALTQDYSEILTSRSVLKKVIASLELDMDYRELAELISIVNPQETHILQIDVTTDAPAESVRIANALIQFGVDRIFRVVGKETPAIIDYAEEDAVAVNKTSLIRHVMLGAILGFILVCGVVSVRFLMDKTIRDEEDVRHLTRYNVLAEIPEYIEEDAEVMQHG